jgi:hypothetical protein
MAPRRGVVVADPARYRRSMRRIRITGLALCRTANPAVALRACSALVEYSDPQTPDVRYFWTDAATLEIVGP